MKIVWVAMIAVVRGHNADISGIGIMNAGIPVRQVLFWPNNVLPEERSLYHSEHKE